LIFEEFDPRKHDSNKVAQLVYSVDKNLYLKLFPTDTEAISAVKKLLLVEKDDFLPTEDAFLGDRNEYRDISEFDPDINNNSTELYVIFDKNISEDSNDILGIVQIVKSKKNSFFGDVITALRNLEFPDAVRFSVMYFLDYFVLAKIEPDDLYIAELAIAEDQRGNGLGTNVLNHVLEKAKDKNFKRAVLDADLTNDGAIKLYKSLGFKIFDRKSLKFFNKERGMYNMEYLLE
jgi:ribosomal protein S18 acetylase RimI-like enzyme